MPEENGKIDSIPEEDGGIAKTKVQAIPAEVLTRFLKLYEKIRKHQKNMLRMINGLKGTVNSGSVRGRNNRYGAEFESFQIAGATAEIQLLHTWGYNQWAEELSDPAISSVAKNLIYLEKEKIQEMVNLFARSHKILMGFPPDGTFNEAIDGIAERIQASWMGAMSRSNSTGTLAEPLKQLRLLRAETKEAQDKLRRIIYSLERDRDVSKILDENPDYRAEISTIHTASNSSDIELLKTWGHKRWSVRLNENLKPGMSSVNTELALVRQSVISSAKKFLEIYLSVTNTPKTTFDAAIEHVKLLAGKDKKAKHWRKLGGA